MTKLIEVKGKWDGITMTDSEFHGFETLISVSEGAELSGVTFNRVRATTLDAYKAELAAKYPEAAAIDVATLREALDTLSKSETGDARERVAVVKGTRLWKTIEGFKAGLEIASTLAALSQPALLAWLQGLS